MYKLINVSLATFISVLSLSSYALEVSFAEKDYEVLSFSSIKPNTYGFNGSSLTIDVDSSAAPLIYPIPSPQKFKTLSFSAKQTGTLNLKASKQGSEENDDFSLKVGLVFEGDKKLNFFQRTVAASWIKKLYSLAPKGTGISNIYFYTVYQDDSLADTKRQHPLSDLLYEEYVGKVDESGNIDIKLDIKEDRKVLALWISADGDDTQSKYQIELNSIVLE